MRRTKSKLKLLYHKKLRAIERKKLSLQKEARESKEFVEIPKTLVGYKIHLELVESMKNKDDGLTEAIAVCTSALVFSEKPFRLCNLKSAKTIFGRLYSWSSTEKEESFFFKNKIYQKGRLSLLDILPDDYKKLSAAAQKYFSARLEKASANGRGVFVYRPNIPKSYLKEREEKLYWNSLSVPNSAAESESKKIENWLDRGKEHELWHYEGYRGWHHFWRRDKSTKQERAMRKAEIKQIIEEFFSEYSE